MSAGTSARRDSISATWARWARASPTAPPAKPIHPVPGPRNRCSASTCGRERRPAARRSRWWRSIRATPTTVSAPDYNNDNFLVDKPWMTIAPNGTMYVSYTAFPTVTGALTTDIVLAVSRDHGDTWSPLRVNDASADRAHGRQLSGLVTD